MIYIYIYIYEKIIRQNYEILQRNYEIDEIIN